MIRAQILIAGASIFLLAFTVYLIKKRKLKEEYAIAWIMAEVVLFFFGVFPQCLGFISRLLGVYYLTSIYIIALFFILGIMFYYSIILSSLFEMNSALVKEVSFLKELCGDKLKNK